jgi:hypothetical protein
LLHTICDARAAKKVAAALATERGATLVPSSMTPTSSPGKGRWMEIAAQATNSLQTLDDVVVCTQVADITRHRGSARRTGTPQARCTRPNLKTTKTHRRSLAAGRRQRTSRACRLRSANALSRRFRGEPDCLRSTNPLAPVASPLRRRSASCRSRLRHAPESHRRARRSARSPQCMSGKLDRVGRTDGAITLTAAT